MKKPVFSLAQVTPLVNAIFDSIFQGQIDKVEVARRKRCGVCEICLAPDCGKCKHCKNMIKFGGNGKLKQACVDRRCPNMAVKEADEEDGLDEEITPIVDTKAKAPKDKTHKFKKQKTKLEWVGDPILMKSSKKYYAAVKVNGEAVEMGECLTVKPDDPEIPAYVGRVMYMWQNSEGEKWFHAHWFTHASDTCLGETGDPTELFVVDDCQDTQLSFAIEKATVEFHAVVKKFLHRRRLGKL